MGTAGVTFLGSAVRLLSVGLCLSSSELLGVGSVAVLLGLWMCTLFGTFLGGSCAAGGRISPGA